MKSLRAKLFVSVGAILLIVALISYLLPEFFIKKDIDKASVHMNERFGESRKKINALASLLLSSQISEKTAELEGISAVVKAMKKEELAPLVLASKIAAYSPSLSFVQIEKGEQIALVTPAGTGCHDIATAFEKEVLWVKVGSRHFKATPLQKGTYLLVESASFPPTLSLNALEEKAPSWLEKIEMIQELAREEKAQGILILDDALQHATCVLSDEVFPPPLVLEKSATPFLLLRQTFVGKEVDQVSAVFLENATVWIGFSLSEIAKNMAHVLSRPVIFKGDGEQLGFLPSGALFDPAAANQSLIPYSIESEGFTFIILTPEEEANSLTRFFTKLRAGLVRKISLNQLVTVLLSLSIALLLLGRISKRITHPITLLANASEEISKGHYENLDLPRVEKRDDEVAVLVHSFENMVVSLRDREKIRGVLNKVVSKEIAEEILKNQIVLGGEERVVTMLFSDIRGFTHLSEGISPTVLIGMLNEYMTRMCRLIDQTKGVVDKFVGDEIMALYGAPLPLENPSVKAIEAALLMLDDLKKWNEELKKRGKLIFEIGIGIHTGLVLSGNMGAENRLNYTVIGANVNLAARLCSAAGPMQILISEEVWQEPEVQQKFTCRKLAPLSLKGIERPVSVYEVI